MIYTPILQGKMGEMNALANLQADQKVKIIPLLQLLPDGSEKRTKDYVQERVKSIVASWLFYDSKIFVDVVNLQDSQPTLIERFLTAIHQAGIHIIPVVYPSTRNDVLLQFKPYSHNGICLRIHGDDMNVPAIDNTTNKIAQFFDTEVNSLDLLIDFSYVVQGNIMHYVNSLSGIFAQLSDLAKYRHVIVGAGSFPADLSAVKKDSIAAIPRLEWDLWKRIKQLPNKPTRLVYADYGNVYPVYDNEQSSHRGTCSIKYTDTDHYHIFKGIRASDSPKGNDQYFDKAKELVPMPYYSGSVYSWGDQYIADCAEKREGPGSSTTWVQVTQNHHFVKLLSLLS